MNCSYSTILFSSLSFFKGMGSALDLGSTYYSDNLTVDNKDIDMQLIAADWIVVGNVLTEVLSGYRDTL